MLNTFNNILAESIGSDEKISKYINLKKDLGKSFEELNQVNASLKFIIEKEKVEKIQMNNLYNDNDIKRNNITLLALILKNILSPNKTNELYTDYYNNEEDKATKANLKQVKKFIDDFNNDYQSKDNIKIGFEDKFKFTDDNETIIEKSEFDYFIAESIFQPSYEIIKQLFDIEFIKNIELNIINNQVVESRNERLKTILPLGIGERNQTRDSHLEPTFKNLLNNIYKFDNQNFNINISIKINLKRNIHFQEEIMFKSFLKKNGITIKRNQEEVINSITDFDFIMLMNNLKG